MCARNIDWVLLQRDLQHHHQISQQTTNIGTFTKEDLEICLKMNLCWIFPEGPKAKEDSSEGRFQIFTEKKSQYLVSYPRLDLKSQETDLGDPQLMMSSGNSPC